MRRSGAARQLLAGRRRQRAANACGPVIAALREVPARGLGVEREREHVVEPVGAEDQAALRGLVVAAERAATRRATIARRDREQQHAVGASGALDANHTARASRDRPRRRSPRGPRARRRAATTRAPRGSRRRARACRSRRDRAPDDEQAGARAILDRHEHDADRDRVRPDRASCSARTCADRRAGAGRRCRRMSRTCRG